MIEFEMISIKKELPNAAVSQRCGYSETSNANEMPAGLFLKSLRKLPFLAIG